MFTVILSEIAAVRIEAACCMPARQLAGAAIAAASNNRLMVIPPDVRATSEVGPLCALADATASAVSAGVTKISTGALASGVLPPVPIEGGGKFVKNSTPA